ncbi:MAG: HAD family hydrolase [Armatimonadetes bacterium]|nr:HAD family hydrolase [Armatimonadota bacterium]
MTPGTPTDLDLPVIFLDNDGVLTDAEAHHVAYCQRYGALMAARFGGMVEAWAEANSAAFHAMMEWYEANADRYTEARFFEDLYQVELGAAFAHMRMRAPDWEPEGRLLMRRLLFECPLGACALFAGAREAVEELALAGYRLCLASNAHSLHCEGVLIGCGLRQHFICAFGPDLVNCATKSAQFYRRVCNHVGVRPEQGIPVDDNGLPLAMASSLGMRTVFVEQGHSREVPQTEPDARIASIAELPSVLDALTEGARKWDSPSVSA